MVKKPSKKTDPLSAALAASFHAAPPKGQVTAQEAPIPASQSATGEGSPPPFDPIKKTTVSLYATDQALVDAILEALQKGKRHRGGFSDAVKIALRLCPVDEIKIGEAWEAARAEDKRRRK